MISPTCVFSLIIHSRVQERFRFQSVSRRRSQKQQNSQTSMSKSFSFAQTWALTLIQPKIRDENLQAPWALTASAKAICIQRRRRRPFVPSRMIRPFSRLCFLLESVIGACYVKGHFFNTSDNNQQTAFLCFWQISRQKSFLSVCFWENYKGQNSNRLAQIFHNLRLNKTLKIVDEISLLNLRMAMTLSLVKKYFFFPFDSLNDWFMYTRRWMNVWTWQADDNKIRKTKLLLYSTKRKLKFSKKMLMTKFIAKCVSAV